MPRTEVLRFTSAVNGVRYALYVRPARVGAAPVVVTLDADYQFAIAANHIEHLADRDQAPETTLVSIGYDGQYPDRERYHINRTRDYTPIHVAAGGYGAQAQAVSGGAPAFVRVIEEEILPMVERRYGASGAGRTIVGHSFGALFGAWLLCTHASLFERYLLVSPSLWYGDGYVLGLPAPVAAAARVFVGVGSFEEQPENQRAMVSQARSFVLSLGAAGGIAAELRVFEGETHASIFPTAFSVGIRSLFS